MKLIASNGASADIFGVSVSLDGDNFIIGAQSKNHNRGQAYTGSVSSVSSVTKLDAGNASRTISGISFISKDDWIIGQTTDRNIVTLSAGDTANVTASGKAIYIGQHAGSDRNTLKIEGVLVANEVYIGSTAGNGVNTLQIATTATFGPVTLRLAPDNVLSLKGYYGNTAAFLNRLGSTSLQVWETDLNIWTNLTTQNAADFITLSFSNGYTNIGAVPEPATCALLALTRCAAATAEERRGYRQTLNIERSTANGRDPPLNKTAWNGARVFSPGAAAHHFRVEDFRT